MIGRWIKRLLWLAILLVIGVGLFALACNIWVTGSTAHRIFGDVEKLPHNTVGVVLGTSKQVASGRENLHFKHRMEAAAKIFHAGKVDHLILSGDDTSDAYYDEPRDMKASLMDLGVPENAITLDGRGVRTLNSILGARETFGFDQFTVISDGFHVSRAVFIASQNGIDAVAFAAEPVEIDKSARSRIREVFARVKAVLDVVFLDAEPPPADKPVRISIQPRA